MRSMPLHPNGYCQRALSMIFLYTVLMCNKISIITLLQLAS